MEIVGCIDLCVGCGNMVPGEQTETFFCSKYANPAGVWRKLGGCAARTHNKSTGKGEDKKPVDPLKASKQKARGVR